MRRTLAAPFAVVVCWLVLDQLFTVVAGHQGLLAPFGPVHVGPAILGLVVIGLRVVVTFLALPWAAWRVGSRLKQASVLSERSRGRASH